MFWFQDNFNASVVFNIKYQLTIYFLFQDPPIFKNNNDFRLFLYVPDREGQWYIYDIFIIMLILINNIVFRTETTIRIYILYTYGYLGKKETLMSVKDFYSAVTPGSSLTHGTGSGVYTIVNDTEVSSPTTYENEKLPTEHDGHSSLLNEVKIHYIIQYSIIDIKRFYSF